jgi:hypothetical protein
MLSRRVSSARLEHADESTPDELGEGFVIALPCAFLEQPLVHGRLDCWTPDRVAIWASSVEH